MAFNFPPPQAMPQQMPQQNAPAPFPPKKAPSRGKPDPSARLNSVMKGLKKK